MGEEGPSLWVKVCQFGDSGPRFSHRAAAAAVEGAVQGHIHVRDALKDEEGQSG